MRDSRTPCCSMNRQTPNTYTRTHEGTFAGLMPKTIDIHQRNPTNHVHLLIVLDLVVALACTLDSISVRGWRRIMTAVRGRCLSTFCCCWCARAAYCCLSLPIRRWRGHLRCRSLGLCVHESVSCPSLLPGELAVGVDGSILRSVDDVYDSFFLRYLLVASVGVFADDILPELSGGADVHST